MVLNRFFFNVLIRVIFIVLSSVVLGIVLQHLDRGLYYTLIGMIFLIAFQAWMLLNLVNKTNADLEKFFASVQNHDSSVRFSEKSKNNSFGKLHNRMNEVNTIIQDIKIENERARQFLQTVVAHVDVGLLSFDNDGRIEIFNRTAKRYLNTQSMQLSNLRTANEELFNIINTIKPGQEILHKIKNDSLLQSILIKSTEIKFESNTIKLISFQDITNELDKKEMDSWQRLIRVLTHEIMNSISPITSLTAVISGYFKKNGAEKQIESGKVSDQIISKTLTGLNTIEETGKGLLDFVDKYRSLTSLPHPAFCRFPVGSLFGKCKILMESNIAKSIKISTNVCPEDLVLEADISQVEQILINLIKNASEALADKKNGTINLRAFQTGKNIILQVADNGAGITDDIIEDIFVPFYTTKQYGTGIGLSLSKQIMKNHNGTISVSSIPDNGSDFTLNFPNFYP